MVERCPRVEEPDTKARKCLRAVLLPEGMFNYTLTVEETECGISNKQNLNFERSFEILLSMVSGHLLILKFF